MAEFTAARLAVHLAPAALRAVRGGHPWVFASGIRKQAAGGTTGAFAVLFGADRQFVGIGLYDEESPIRVRVLHAGSPVTLDTAWLRERLAAALARRAALAADPETTGYRLVHGENDGLPGLVVDRYDRTLVVKLYTAAWYPHLPVVQALLAELVGPERLVLRLSRAIAASPVRGPGQADGAILLGPPLTGPVIFREHGLRFAAEPIVGQKTGFYLDQRDNRARVEGLARGATVLNVCAYTGGFSLYAARGGARAVASLDLNPLALRAAEANFALNAADPRVAACPHATLCADAFAGLAELAQAGRRFDLVILDPPSFARKQADVPGALAAYDRLARLGLGVLAPGGLLVAASCSAQVTAAAFLGTVHAAAERLRRPLTEVARTGHALDHPIGFPEGAYLKCLYARA